MPKGDDEVDWRIRMRPRRHQEFEDSRPAAHSNDDFVPQRHSRSDHSQVDRTPQPGVGTVRAPLARLKSQTVELIARALSAKSTSTDTPPPDQDSDGVEVVENYGGDDGVRTRDLRRDRPAL
jgi:hypothetical protein